MAKTFSPLGVLVAGSHGVDVFFVISGFVMYTAARGESVATFYCRRLIRVAPLYWLATLAAIQVHFFLTGSAISRLNLLKSLAFIPFFNPSFDGRIWPLLVPGWTLNYEMFFYALFGVTLAFRRPLILVWLVLPALVALGHALPLRSAPWQTYTNPLLLEFAAGLVIGWGAGAFNGRWLALLLPAGMVALLLADGSPLPPIVLAGAAAISIVIGALAIEIGGHLPAWPWARLLGDASYSLYVVHAFVIDLLAAGWHSLELSRTDQFVPFCAVGIATSLAAGIATHLLVEKPLTRWLNKGINHVMARSYSIHPT